MSCFRVKNGKVHRLVADDDTERFPLGRAKCAPFPRLKSDTTLEPNEAGSDEFCRLCL